MTHLIQALDWSDNLDVHTVTAGFSVGELSALIFSGALSFDDGRSFMINDINYSPISITQPLIKHPPPGHPLKSGQL